MSQRLFGNSSSRKSSSKLRRASGKLRSRLSRFEALEKRHLLAVLTVNTNADNTNSDNFLTLREALAVVHAGTATGTVSTLGRALSAAESAQVNTTVAFGTDDRVAFSGVVSPIALGAELSVESSVTILGPGATNLTLNAQTTSRAFYISPSAVDVTIQGLTLTGGDSGTGNSGGAIFSAASGLLTIADSVISGNVADVDGGAIYAAGDVVISATKIGDPAGGSGNDAVNGDGGGIKALGNITVRNNSSISGNTAKDDGGALYSLSSVTVEDSTIGGAAAGFGNTATNDDGGGIHALSVTITRSSVTGNTAGNDGGGIYARGSATIKSSTISGNTAADDGGGIFSINGSVNLDASTIGGSAVSAANKATSGDGGGIYARNMTAQNSTIAGNEAGVDGGGIRSTTTATIRNSTVSGNAAKKDGGGLLGFNVTLQNATVASNKADSDAAGGGTGGGVFSSNRLTLQNSIVVGNTDAGTTNPDVRIPTTTYVRSSLIGNLGTMAAGAVGTQFEVTGATQQTSAFKNFVGKGLSTIALNTVLEDNGAGVAKLQNNNGASTATTETIKLIGVAIDKGSNTFVVNAGLGDQRGLPFARIFNGTVDLGAFEVQTDSPEINVQVGGASVASGGTAANVGSLNGTLIVPVTIQNSGTAALNLTLPITVAGANASDFVVTQPGSNSIPAGGSLSFNVAFTPSANGLRTATLSITNNDSDENPYSVVLQGTGVGVAGIGPPEINVQVSGVDVATGGTAANVGATGAAIIVPITIQNTGGTPLSLTGAPLPVTVSGANASDFVVTQPATTIAAGGSVTFNVSFMPTANGLRTATLSIPNNDATGGENPYTLTLQGTGAGVVAGPEVNLQVNGADIVSGGTADLGATNTTLNRTVTIQNVGSSALNLTGAPLLVTVSGANAGEFVVTQPAANTVAAGNSLSFNVAFTPSGNGVRTATLTIPNNDSNENPYTIILQGNNGSVGSSTLFSENFDDGTIDPKLTPQSGTFALSSNAYSGTRNNVGQNAISTIESLTLPSHYRVDATVNMAGGNGSSLWSNGLIIFDYVDANNFKYAGAFEIVDKYIIGQVVNGKATHLVQTSAALASNSNVNLSLEINGAAATLFANGSQVVTRTFKSAFTGRVGVGTLNANTRFDNIVVTQLT